MNKKKVYLSDLRKAHKLSQRDLARELNVSYGLINAYENGTRNPSYGRAKEIANLFNVSLDCLSFSNLGK